MGLIFENLAVRDLRIYADALDGSIAHYRDKNGLECDAVLHRRNGSYGLIEIKLGGDRLIEEGAGNLNKLASKIDTTKMKEPFFLWCFVQLLHMPIGEKMGFMLFQSPCLDHKE